MDARFLDASPQIHGKDTFSSDSLPFLNLQITKKIDQDTSQPTSFDPIDYLKKFKSKQKQHASHVPPPKTRAPGILSYRPVKVISPTFPQ